MDLQLTGKRSLVTGSTSGIREQIAKTLAQDGASVILQGRRAFEAERVVHATGADQRRHVKSSCQRDDSRTAAARCLPAGVEKLKAGNLFATSGLSAERGENESGVRA